MQFNSRIITQTRMHLAGTGFDGYDPDGTVLEGVIAEAAGAAADIQDGFAFKIQLEHISYRCQLQRPPAHILTIGHGLILLWRQSLCSRLFAPRYTSGRS